MSLNHYFEKALTESELEALNEMYDRRRDATAHALGFTHGFGEYDTFQTAGQAAVVGATAGLPIQIPAGSAPWLQIAQAEVGVSEVKGSLNNPRIVEYANTVGFSNDEVSWCSAFVNWAITRSGLKGTNSASSRSWMNYGRASELVPGAIVVFARPPDPTKGHVGFFIGFAGDRLQVLGGNQSNQVKISNYARTNLLSVRWPN